MQIQEHQNVGTAKYVVSWHTNKKHKDGSDFYDVKIFRNKKEKEKFIKELNKSLTK